MWKTGVRGFFKALIIETSTCFCVEGVVVSVNDDGFVVEMASLIVLLLFGVVIVSVCYGFFKTANWLYKKTRRQPAKTQASKSESEG